jgi:hypothetical protein
MPARVFDRLHIALEDDQAIVDKIQRLPAQQSNQTLVVFFNIDKTAKYVSSSELEHCDMDQRPSKSASSNVIAAFKRAKEFWDEYQNDD